MKTSEKDKQLLLSKRSQARAGEFWTINNADARGHKSLITKRRKNGTFEYISVTHTQKPKHYAENIELKQNPQPDDNAKSYAVPKVRKATIRHIGKHQPDMKITNKIDKSVIRKIKSK